MFVFFFYYSTFYEHLSGLCPPLDLNELMYLASNFRKSLSVQQVQIRRWNILWLTSCPQWICCDSSSRVVGQQAWPLWEEQQSPVFQRRTTSLAAQTWQARTLTSDLRGTLCTTWSPSIARTAATQNLSTNRRD